MAYFYEKGAIMPKKAKITFCGSWGYRPKAAGLADELKQKYGIESELVQSSGGVFEVEVDSKLIFSKQKLGRFPNDGEIVKLLS